MRNACSPSSAPDTAEPGWLAVGAAFRALGRVCLGIDAELRVVHASDLLDDLCGPGAAARLTGRPLAELLGDELFGPRGALRDALAAGQRREGRRAALRLPDGGERVVSLSIAPLGDAPRGAWSARVRHLVVLRPAEDEAAEETASYGGLIGRSPAMRRVFHLIANLENSEATVLLTGESGAGKEVVARAIHAASPRRDGPFVAVNCAALPADLLEAELFGQARGALTGAVRDRVGRVELADDGTLFLDEIGDVPLLLQVKLLRLLQERTFERVGESRSRPMTARLIAATHVDLPRAVAEGRFREDLHDRLRVVPIELPPLRERREDVEPLARHLLTRVGIRHGHAPRLAPDALRLLLAHDFPGNVRELENLLEHAVAVCHGPAILPEHLPEELGRLAPPPARPAAPAASAGVDERARIRRALEEHRWSREEAARALGISRTTLWRKMRELGLARRAVARPML
jgi:DNA-binding NtrC family response regulator